MLDSWHESIDNRDLNGIVFFLEFKAFHSIDNNILLRNMKDQFELKIIIELNWLEYYILDSRKTRMFSPWHDANTQLKRYSVESVKDPGGLLFLLYINYQNNYVTTTQSLAYLLMIHR